MILIQFKLPDFSVTVRGTLPRHMLTVTHIMLVLVLLSVVGVGMQQWFITRIRTEEDSTLSRLCRIRFCRQCVPALKRYTITYVAMFGCWRRAKMNIQHNV